MARVGVQIHKLMLSVLDDPSSDSDSSSYHSSSSDSKYINLNML